jgi:pyruvate/2-oxoglutarate dehydrogenase complex dihydrolipoamide dehydrogenase (E3) component
MEKYSHIIVGTGQASGTLLGKLLETGERIAVIEAEKVGGSCVNYGCTPTKSLVASAKAMHNARRGSTYGFTVESLKVDYKVVRERMNEIRNSGREGFVDRLESADQVTFIRGHARFIGPKSLRVGDLEISGDRIYLNVGTYPFLPPIEGIENIPWLDSAGLLDLAELPSHLVIVGGGYVGVELAQIYRRFDAEVTIIQGANQLMPDEDADVAGAIREILEGEGIKVHTNARATKVDQAGEKIKVVVEMASGERAVEGSHLLVAAGRRPNSGRLNL